MATSLEELLNKYGKQQQAYTPLSPEQIQQQATNRYQSVYDQKRLSANQAYQTSDQALARQLEGLQGTYDRQRKDTEKGFRQTYSAADRQALTRGMQRSSYNNATLANINLQGQEAQRDINDAQAKQEAAIGEQRTLYAQQLAQQLAQYNATQKADELAYIDELQAREYDREQAQQQMGIDLALAIYNAQLQREKMEQDQANWEAEFAFQQAQANKKSSGSSSGTKKTSPATISTTNAFNALMAGLSVGAGLKTSGNNKNAGVTGVRSVVDSVAKSSKKK